MSGVRSCSAWRLRLGPLWASRSASHHRERRARASALEGRQRVENELPLPEAPETSAIGLRVRRSDRGNAVWRMAAPEAHFDLNDSVGGAVRQHHARGAAFAGVGRHEVPIDHGDRLPHVS